MSKPSAQKVKNPLPEEPAPQQAQPNAPQQFTHVIIQLPKLNDALTYLQRSLGNGEVFQLFRAKLGQIDAIPPQKNGAE